MTCLATDAASGPCDTCGAPAWPLHIVEGPERERVVLGEVVRSGLGMFCERCCPECAGGKGKK